MTTTRTHTAPADVPGDAAVYTVDCIHCGEIVMYGEGRSFTRPAADWDGSIYLVTHHDCAAAAR
jgi:hypothetical protein